MKKALIVIDMVNDFVDGALANKDAYEIIPNIKQMLTFARGSDDWVVVFSNDAHKKEDREMRLWGEHAMRGTHGAEVVSALKPRLSQREWLCPKTFYGAFEETPLAKDLKDCGVEEVYLTGQHTNCCVRHTAYGAFRHGFEIFVLQDGVVPFGGETNESACQYLKTIYGATLTSVKEVSKGEVVQ